MSDKHKPPPSAQPYPGAIRVIAEPTPGRRYDFFILPDPRDGYLIVWPGGPVLGRWSPNPTGQGFLLPLVGRLLLHHADAIEKLATEAVKR